MKIHEFQAKDLLAAAGAPIPRGIVAATPDEAAAAFDKLGGRPVVLKAQVHAGGGPDEFPPVSPGERLVEFAYRAALMGILACPPLLHVYSLVLLLWVGAVHDDLPPAANRRWWAALVIDLIVIGTAALLVRAAVRSTVVEVLVRPGSKARPPTPPGSGVWPPRWNGGAPARRPR